MLLGAWPAAAENARLSYGEICRIQKVQVELHSLHTNLALDLQMRSTQTNVKSGDISAFIDSKSGKIPLPLGADGTFGVPVREDLLAEDPWIVVNQPRGTMELKWHAGFAPSFARRLTNSIRYATVMRVVKECDDVQEKMRPFFPSAPRLTMVGVRLTFRQPATSTRVVIHAKGGDRQLPADADGEIILPLDADLMDEDPLLTLTERPVAVEVVWRAGAN
jgi:hypothetical protein